MPEDFFMLCFLSLTSEGSVLCHLSDNETMSRQTELFAGGLVGDRDENQNGNRLPILSRVPCSSQGTILVATKQYPSICLLKQDDEKTSSCRQVSVCFYLSIYFGFRYCLVFLYWRFYLMKCLARQDRHCTSNLLGDYPSGQHLEKERITEQKDKV